MSKSVEKQRDYSDGSCDPQFVVFSLVVLIQTAQGKNEIFS